MGSKLYVGNLSYNVTSSDLEQLFGAARHRPDRRSHPGPRHRPQQGLRLRPDGQRRRGPGRHRRPQRPGARRPHPHRQRGQAPRRPPPWRRRWRWLRRRRRRRRPWWLRRWRRWGHASGSNRSHHPTQGGESRRRSRQRGLLRFFARAALCDPSGPGLRRDHHLLRSWHPISCFTVTGIGSATTLRERHQRKTRNDDLKDLGEIHFGRKHVPQPSREELRAFYREAENRLEFPVVWFRRRYHEVIGAGFEEVVRQTRFATSSRDALRVAGMVPQRHPFWPHRPYKVFLYLPAEVRTLP